MCTSCPRLASRPDMAIVERSDPPPKLIDFMVKIIFIVDEPY